MIYSFSIFVYYKTFTHTSFTFLSDYKKLKKYQKYFFNKIYLYNYDFYKTNLKKTN